jgi:hypothetical protein
MPDSMFYFLKLFFHLLSNLCMQTTFTFDAFDSVIICFHSHSSTLFMHISLDNQISKLFSFILHINAIPSVHFCNYLLTSIHLYNLIVDFFLVFIKLMFHIVTTADFHIKCTLYRLFTKKTEQQKFTVFLILIGLYKIELYFESNLKSYWTYFIIRLLYIVCIYNLIRPV